MTGPPIFARREFGLSVLLAILANLYLILYFDPAARTTPPALGSLALVTVVILGIGLVLASGKVKSAIAQTGMVVLGLAVVLGIGLARVPQADLLNLVLDCVWGFGMFALVTGLASQFILPVTRLHDRALAFDRLRRFLFGVTGPVVLVQDGRLIQRDEEAHGHPAGAGVVLVDSVSAVALQTDTRYTRAAGRGVIFTSDGEYIADTLDLRKQRRTLDLPALPDPGTPDEPRPVTTNALTRDGIEVTASITVVFRLDPGASPHSNGREAEDQPPRFNGESAFRAVYGKAVSEKYKDVPWTDLPGLLAVDVWRELILQLDLDDLFETDRPGTTPIHQLRARVQARLTPPRDVEPPSREAEILESRGIRVLAVSIGSLTLPKDLMDKRIKNWQATWKQRAEAAAAERDPVIRSRRQAGDVAGTRAGGEALTSELLAALLNGRRPGFGETLRMIVKGAIKLGVEEKQDVERIKPLDEWTESL